MKNVNDEDTISVGHAFDAMRVFLERYWIRGERRSDDLAVLIDLLDRDLAIRPMPLDPAMWSDWIDALKQVGPSVSHE